MRFWLDFGIDSHPPTLNFGALVWAACYFPGFSIFTYNPKTNPIIFKKTSRNDAKINTKSMKKSIEFRGGIWRAKCAQNGSKMTPKWLPEFPGKSRKPLPKRPRMPTTPQGHPKTPKDHHQTPKRHQRARIYSKRNPKRVPKHPKTIHKVHPKKPSGMRGAIRTGPLRPSCVLGLG